MCDDSVQLAPLIVQDIKIWFTPKTTYIRGYNTWGGYSRLRQNTTVKHCFKNTWRALREAYSEPCQTSMIQRFTIMVDFWPLTTFTKRSILDIWQGSEYACLRVINFLHVSAYSDRKKFAHLMTETICWFVRVYWHIKYIHVCCHCD